MIAELTNHVWQSTIFAIAVGLVTLALRRNRAQVRYWLWLSGSVKFLLPFSILIAFGKQLGWASRIHSVVSTPAVRLAVVQVSAPFSGVSAQVALARPAHDWAAIGILGVWACGVVWLVSLRLHGWLRVREAVRFSAPLDFIGTMQVRSSPGLLEPGVVGLSHPILLPPAGIEERLLQPQLKAVLAQN